MPMTKRGSRRRRRNDIRRFSLDVKTHVLLEEVARLVKLFEGSDRKLDFSTKNQKRLIEAHEWFLSTGTPEARRAVEKILRDIGVWL